MEVVVFGAIAAAIPVGIFLANAWGRTLARQRAEHWRAIAARRGARFHEPDFSWTTYQPAAIEAVVEHAIVLLDSYMTGGRGSAQYTRARARFACGAGPSFRVYRERFLSTIAKALGNEDAILGDDPAFDDAFVVKCGDEKATRIAWTPRARRLMLRPLSDVLVVSDGAEVTLTMPGVITDAAVIEAMLDLAGELASYGAFALAALADAWGARLVTNTASWSLPFRAHVLVETNGGQIEARSLNGRGGPRLSLVLAHRRELPFFTTDLVDGRLAEGAPRGLLSDDAHGMLGALENATITGNGRHLRIVFPTMPTHEIAESAAKVLVELAGGARSSGVFR